MDNINVTNLILHILDNTHQAPILSVRELELELEVREFFEKHVAKILTDSDLKKAAFNSPENRVYNLLQQLVQTQDLAGISCEFANMLFGIMKENLDVPSGDAAFLVFENLGVYYFGMLKLNYKNSYIHYVANTDDGVVNQLIKQKATLPNEGQKVDECIIVNLNTYELQILDKQYEINGEKDYYLSKHFLQCESDLSNRQKLRILDKAVSKVSKKYLQEEFDKVAKLRSHLAESIEESNEIKVEAVAQEVFGDSYEVKQEYLEEVRKAGLVDNVITLPEAQAGAKKFKTQKLKTDSGIEINFPSNLYNNKEIMEFINNPDGTVSILIKNVHKVQNK